MHAKTACLHSALKANVDAIEMHTHAQDNRIDLQICVTVAAHTEAVISCSPPGHSEHRVRVGDGDDVKDTTANMEQLRYELAKARLDVEGHLTTITILQSSLRAMERTILALETIEEC